MLKFKLLSLVLLLLGWKAGDERAVFSWCWQQEQFSAWMVLAHGFFQSHYCCLNRCVKEYLLFLPPDKYSYGAKVSWIQESTWLENWHCWEQCLLGDAVRTLCAGTACSECVARFGKAESFSKCLGINECYIELPLKVAGEEWICSSTSIKISP